MTQRRRTSFWGPPSHRPIAWTGAIAGLAVLALAAVITANTSPLFALSVYAVGLAEFGWAAELLPRAALRAAGWARFARWFCALAGTALAVIALILGQAPALWFGAVIAGTGLLLSLEMAPNGPANRPK